MGAASCREGGRQAAIGRCGLTAAFAAGCRSYDEAGRLFNCPDNWLRLGYIPLCAWQAPRPDVAHELIAITGRFQPFHRDHLELVRIGLDRATRVIIGITNPDDRSLRPVETSPHRHLGTANPFTYYERQRMIRNSLLGDGVAAADFGIVPFPLDVPSVWHSYVPVGTAQLVRLFSAWEQDKARRLREAGYEVVEIEGDMQTRIAATAIRTAIANGSSWRNLVPRGTSDVIESLGERTVALRCRAGSPRP